MVMFKLILLTLLIISPIFANKKSCQENLLNYKKSIVSYNYSEEFDNYYLAAVERDLYLKYLKNIDWSILKTIWEPNIEFGPIVSISSVKIFPDQLFILTTHKSGKVQLFTETPLFFSGKEYKHLILDRDEKVIEAQIHNQSFDLTHKQPTFILLFKTNKNQLYFAHAILNYKNDLLPLLGYKKLIRENPFYAIFTQNNCLIVVEKTGDILLAEYPYKGFQRIGKISIETSGEIIGLSEQHEKNMSQEGAIGFNVVLKEKSFKKSLLRMIYSKQEGLMWSLIENYKPEVIQLPVH